MREKFPSIEAPRRGSSRRAVSRTSRHPYWSGLAAEHYLDAPELAGIEVFNGGAEQQQGNGLSVVHWDDILQRGRACHGIASDDSHYTGQDSRLAWTMIRAPERSRAAVLEALRSGCFYATTGPEIRDVRIDDDGVDGALLPGALGDAALGLLGRLRGQLPSAQGMNWRGRVTERTDDGSIVGRALRAARVPPRGRVEVAAADGGRAWGGCHVLKPAP